MVTTSSSSWIVRLPRRSTHVKNAPQLSVRNSLTLWLNACKANPAPGRTKTEMMPPNYLMLAVGRQVRTRAGSLAWGRTHPSHSLVFYRLSRHENHSSSNSHNNSNSETTTGPDLPLTPTIEGL